MENSMKKIRIAQVVLNIACGGNKENVEKSYALAEKLTGCKPVRTLASKKARTFKIRKGIPIGVKVTVRGVKSYEFLKKSLTGVDNRLNESCFDSEGNFGFGLKEYLDIPGEKYNPEWGIIGMNITVSLERAGYRIKKRKIRKRKIAKAHRISKNEAIDFVKKDLEVEIS